MVPLLGLAIVGGGALLILARKGLHREFRYFLIGLLAVKVVVMATVGKDVYAGIIGGSYDGLYNVAAAMDLAQRSSSISALYQNLRLDIGSTGTSNLADFLGIIYYFTTPSSALGHMVFATLGVLGVYWAYRGIRLAFPELPWRRYVYLLALMPSVFVFSSMVLKDAPSLALLGLFVYGVAVLFRRSVFRGAAIVGLAIFLMLYVRPYLAFFMGVAAGVGLFVRLWGVRADVLTPLWRGALLVVFGGALVWGFSSLSTLYLVPGTQYAELTILEYFGGTKESVAHQKESNPEHSGVHVEVVEGRGRDIRDPGAWVSVPGDLVAIFLRPFIWEAWNLNSIVAGLENLFLLYLFYRIIRGVRPVMKLHGRDPVLVVMLTFVVVFGLGFTLVVGNLGTAYRIKSMTYPFLLGLYAVAEGSARVMRTRLSPQRKMLAR